ncbi:MAG TPA: hypothetical protein VGR28_06250 [Candidatus Thermoplasmatota archaeon]|jgi:hypothetical protein|nr:hypothetical protein [Candidatus Thermoplasmatota archaeon]
MALAHLVGSNDDALEAALLVAVVALLLLGPLLAARWKRWRERRRKVTGR